MNLLNELLAKTSIVIHHENLLAKAVEKAVLPGSYLLTVHHHRDRVTFSLNIYPNGIQFSPTGQLLKAKGMTRVAGYILLQEFKALNS